MANRRNFLRQSALGLVGVLTGCSAFHKINPRLPTITGTSLTTSFGEKRLVRLDDIGDVVYSRGTYQKDGLIFTLPQNYATLCSKLGLDSSTEPRIRPATRFDVINTERGINLSVVSDLEGCIDINGRVYKVEGRKMSEIREAIKRDFFGSATSVNLNTIAYEAPPNFGMVYFIDLIKGTSGQEPIFKRSLYQIATKYGLMKDTKYLFIFRENSDGKNSHYFVLVVPATKTCLGAYNAPIAHNDIILAGNKKTTLQTFEAELGRFAGIIGYGASASTSAKTIDQNIGYFEKSKSERRQ